MTQRMSSSWCSRRSRALDGALAAIAQLAVAELAAALLPGGRSPLTGVGAALIDASPGPGVDVVVATAESADKALLMSSLIGGWLVVGGAAAVQGGSRGRLILAGAGLGAGVSAAARRDAAAGASLAAGLTGALAGAGNLALFDRSPDPGRRGLIAAGAAAALSAAAARRRAERTRLQAQRDTISLPAPVRPNARAPVTASFDIAGLTPLFTPPERFYLTDVSFPRPRVDADRWRLRVHGMVNTPLELSFQDLLSMELVELDATLVCVHNPVGGPRIGSARWLGVPVHALLDLAGAQPDGEQLVARSVDGFSAGVPVDRVRGEQPALIAVGMNGHPLPVENGYPARLLVPGLWGADANTKWLQELELTTWGAVRDYWDRRGWPRVPSAVRPGSRIDVPANRTVLPTGPITVAGVAWAPPGGVERVEVSVDNGPWQSAELASESAPTMWRQWRWAWPALPGPHELRVRTHGRDRAQGGDPEPPYPVGSSGWHTARVHVTPGASTARRRALGRATAAADDVRRRATLGAAAVPAWRARGFPPAPRFPAPRTATT